MQHLRPSRALYRDFVAAYREHRLDPPDGGTEKAPQAPRAVATKRREYLREYIAWLWPHRFGIVTFFALALVAAGPKVAEPLFMRFIIARVLLNTALGMPERISRLHMTGSAFVAVILLSNGLRVFRDYRQRLLNVRVMLSLRRTLFDRLLHLPL